MTTKTRGLLVSMLLVLVPGSLHGCSAPPAATAPATTAATPSERDPQAAYEPKSAPGDGQQYLARMVGDWDVVKTFHRRDGGSPAVTRGTCHQTMVQEGRFLQSEFVFEGDNGRTTGTGVIGFDPATRTFTSFWIDSRSTRVSIRQSEPGFDDNAVRLFSRSLGEPKDARRSRTESRVDPDGQHMAHRQWSLLPDGGERLVMELAFTRMATKP